MDRKAAQELGSGAGGDVRGFYHPKGLGELSGDHGRTELPSPPPVYEMAAEAEAEEAAADYVGAGHFVAGRTQSYLVAEQPSSSNSAYDEIKPANLEGSAEGSTLLAGPSRNASGKEPKTVKETTGGDTPGDTEKEQD